jgi:pyruvate,water dikinase
VTDRPYVLPLAGLDRHSVAEAGGKAANLGELIRAGFTVPSGFCVTSAAYALAAEGAGLDRELGALAATDPAAATALADLAGGLRARLAAAPVPAPVTAAVAEAYARLGSGGAPPVAVRSSATAEDLPMASFAGQQDTYLHVVGADAVIEAVRRCWASLWTDRAVSYRSTNRIDHGSVRLAVVVQEMVDAAVAGVLFTANPLTGRRREVVIDASPGLGEAIVSGAVNPDHFVVRTATGAIVVRRIGDKRVAVRPAPGGSTRRVELPDASGEPCLSDEEVRALAALGAGVEAHYAAPQDIEWALDAERRTWLTQARPITTLFPLPPGAPPPDGELRVYFSVNVAQGVLRPLTPMGVQALRLLGAAMAGVWGVGPRDPVAGPAPLVEAAQRLFFDITPALRNRLGRRIALAVTSLMEARSSAVLRSLLEADARLAPTATPAWRTGIVLAVAVARTRIPFRVVRALARPPAARKRAARAAAEALALGETPDDAAPAARLDALERMLLEGLPRLFRNVFPLVLAGALSNVAAMRLLGDLASSSERWIVTRALPHNPTTVMDLALWTMAEHVRAIPASHVVVETSAADLAARYRAASLPEQLQRELARFLDAYGHRGVAEIDLGLPRWREDPAHILGVLAAYLEHTDPAQAPDVQFARARLEGEALVAELGRRAARASRLRGALVRFLLSRMRALFGLREAPKEYLVRLLGRGRTLLRPVGEHLARAGRLDAPEDIFFIDLPEARSALAGADLRPVVRERRESYTRELRRRAVPRILLSDGTAPTGAAPDDVDSGDALRGAPASPGTVTASARVMLHPADGRVAPGEILVAPSTDPGWTPLFLVAGGLVMEMGGAMSHGAVVAREYGIPAVVGVADATERIASGRVITVDGGSGLVHLKAG